MEECSMKLCHPPIISFYLLLILKILFTFCYKLFEWQIINTESQEKNFYNLISKWSFSFNSFDNWCKIEHKNSKLFRWKWSHWIQWINYKFRQDLLERFGFMEINRLFNLKVTTLPVNAKIFVARSFCIILKTWLPNEMWTTIWLSLRSELKQSSKLEFSMSIYELRFY